MFIDENEKKELATTIREIFRIGIEELLKKNDFKKVYIMRTIRDLFIDNILFNENFFKNLEIKK